MCSFHFFGGLCTGIMIVFLFSACSTVENNGENLPVLPSVLPPVDINSFEDMKKEVEKFDSKGAYRISYNIIENYLKRNYSAKAMSFAIYHAIGHYSQLHEKNKTCTKSIFIAPNVWRGKEDKAKQQTFLKIGTEEIKQVINQFDLLKKNLKLYQTMLRNYPLHGTQEEKNIYLKQNEILENTCERTIRSYCLFISYEVISPCLAETSKSLYIATIGINDKEKIKEAVFFLCRAFHKEWLYAADEEVRLQFCDVVKEMKDIIGSEEWEELKMLTTLLDCRDNSKNRGTSVWWNEK